MCDRCTEGPWRFEPGTFLECGRGVKSTGVATLMVMMRQEPFVQSQQRLRSLTGAVGVHRQALVNVALDEQEGLLEDLPSAGLLHRVGITRVPEKCQQLSRGTRLTGGMRGRKKKREE